MVLPLGDVVKTRIIPAATWSLLALNVLVFLLQLTHGESFTLALSATPIEVAHSAGFHPVIPPGRLSTPAYPGPIRIPTWLTLLTAMFLHGSPLHLAGNLLALWIYGDNVEEVLGTARFVLLYLGCGLAGTLLQVVDDPGSVTPTLGASGAIAGVMGMYLVWFPLNRVRVLILWTVTEWPAMVVIGLWILVQVFRSLGTLGHVGDEDVAYLAHVGGASIGVLAALIYHDRARAIILRKPA